MDAWQTLRLQFPVADQHVYLNHAAVSPLPLRCKDYIERYLHELVHHGAANYPGAVFDVLERARELGGRLIGAAPEHVFIVRSTTQGLAVVATGMPGLGQGDNVVLVEREFPANLRPWLPLRRRGVELRMVPQRQGRVVLDDLAAAIDSRTAVVSVSFVQFLSGFRIDVGAVASLCREHDALFVLDAIQGLGAFPIDVEAMGVDFLSADAHKWLLGPEGVGLGYASPRALERIEPSVEGWFAVKNPFNFFDLDQPLKETAARYEEGAYNVAGVHGLVGSLELLLQAGVDNLAPRILELTDHLAQGLRARGWSVLSPREVEAEKSGIVLAERSGVDFEALRLRLAERGIQVSIRDNKLRVAPHGYNTREELDRLLEAL